MGPPDGFEMADSGRGPRGCLLCHMSLHVARVKPEPESRVKFESGSFLLFSFSFYFFFVLIKGSDCDSCFHNDVPTDVKSIIVNAIARIHC